MTAREELIAKLSEFDEPLAEKFILGEHISDKDIVTSMRYALRNHNAVALHCGSALKNRGIQPLLENVISLLPSPQEKESVEGMEFTSKQKIYRFSNAKDKLCAFAFKVVADPVKGLITFFRVYSGTLKNRSKITNSRTGETEKITQLFRMTADEISTVEELSAGDIGAIMGADSIRSGDTFIEEMDTERILLTGVKIPPPVFFCSIEAEMSRDQRQLEKVLKDLSYEDPSITVTESKETGQLQISGMGELHLEILRDRIELDYGIKAELGSMRVAYRESVSGSEAHTQTIEKVIGGRQRFAELKLSLEGVEASAETADSAEAEDFSLGNLSEKSTEDSTTSLTETESANEIVKDFLKLEKHVEKRKVEDDMSLKRSLKKDQRSDEYEVLRSLDSAPKEFITAIEEGINTVLESGALLGYPVINTKVKIIDGKWSSLRSDDLTFKECAVKCMRELFQKSNKKLLEPFMRAEIEVPEHCLGDILSNLSGQKGGKIISIKNVKQKFTDDIDSEKRIISCLVPLSQIIGYSKYLRSVTKGEGKFIMSFSHFKALQPEKQKEILENPFL